jgi:hypothetical protein
MCHTGEAEMATDEESEPQGFCQFCGLEDPTLNSEVTNSPTD